MGSTLPVLQDWFNDPSLGVAELKAMTEATAAAIYGSQYWNQLRCDGLPNGIDLMVFDYGVNSGQPTSARLLQVCVGAKVDGHIGSQTLAAAHAANVDVLMSKLVSGRIAHDRACRNFAIDGKGWVRRADECFTTATSLLTSPQVSV